MSDATPAMKSCSRKDCMQSNPQPVSEFYKDKSRPDGLTSGCRSCIKAKTQTPQARESRQKWAARNKDKRRQSSRRHYEVNREEILAKMREAREADPELFRERYRKWQARTDRPCRMAKAEGCTEFAEPGREHCRKHHNIYFAAYMRRRSARVRLRVAARQNGTCPWCGVLLDLVEAEWDHIIPRSVIAIEEEWNWQLLHGPCNQAKAARLTPEAVALAAEHGIDLTDGARSPSGGSDPTAGAALVLF